MKNTILTFATVALLLTACKKAAEPTTAQGRITTLGTDSALAGIAVTLIEDNYGSGVVGSGNGRYNGPLKTVYTDQDGYYRIDHNCYPGTAYWIEAETAQGHFGPIQKQAVYPGQNNTINIPQIPFAWLKVRFKNVNPYNVYDKINYHLLNTGAFGGLQGPGIDETVIFKAAGNSENYLNYAVLKNQLIVLNRTDTIFLNKGDTVYHEVLY